MNTRKDLLGATSTNMIFNGMQGLNNTSDSAPENMTQPTYVSEKPQHKAVHNQHFLVHTPFHINPTWGTHPVLNANNYSRQTPKPIILHQPQRQFVSLNHPHQNTQLVNPHPLMRASHVHYGLLPTTSRVFAPASHI